MRNVAPNVVAMVVNMADRSGVGLDGLTLDLPVTPDELRSRWRGLHWDVFTMVLERLEARIGYDRLEALCANIPVVAIDDVPLLSRVVSVNALYRIVNDLVGPVMYPMFRSRYETKADGSKHLEMELRDGLRDCLTLFRLMGPAQAAIPCFLGLPPAQAIARATPRSVHVHIAPYVDGDSPVADPGGESFAREAFVHLERDKARLREAHEMLWESRDNGFQRRLDDAMQLWALTPRQQDVLRGLARGRSNKELAKELRCSTKTVETHITELLRRSGRPSRLALVASFWSDL